MGTPSDKLDVDSVAFRFPDTRKNSVARQRRRACLRAAALVLLALLVYYISGLSWSGDLPELQVSSYRSKTVIDRQLFKGPLPPAENSTACPQVDVLFPGHNELDSDLDELYASSAFRSNAYDLLGGAIQIPTESYDDLAPVGQDPRWEIFGTFNDYIEQSFPVLHAKLKLTKVNTYALVYHWQGSNGSLLPVLLMAHEDVVPVEPTTIDDWIHPPYSGFYDGTWIWGRGSCDDKSSLIGILVAVESLIKKGFTPSRSVVLAFGIDEESAGTQGAGHLAGYLEETYGKDGLAMILDEGGGYGTPYGDDVLFATPATSEKGYLDARIEVSASGGHSSVPPPHTAIGMLSSMISALEAHPHETQLLRSGTPFLATQCFATYGPEYPEKLRWLAEEARTSDVALAKLKTGLLAADRRNSALLGTTQAVDLIQGGVKVNALPEHVEAIVNHRIAEHSSVDDVKQHILGVLLPIATKFNLTLDAFGKNISAGTGNGGHVVLSDAWGPGLEPSPVTPTGIADPFAILAGTIKATFTTTEGYDKKGVIVSPMLSLGNTDTARYWNLTKHIFRYDHSGEGAVYGDIHTINEARLAEAYIQQIRFYTKFILNTTDK
ncbi:carboxypeptidase S [Obba rivulosa]|uniref:Carboxypeptidase S n=1 Tax=Obba rivulosa TaxID=1052685 RepID=A0A8E2AMM7_9APHY|nr:carboxypeptidase S [Obba rivulosa]